MGLYLLGTINPKTGLVSSNNELFNNKPLPENINQLHLDGLLPPDAADMFPCAMALLSTDYGNIRTRYGGMNLIAGDMIVHQDDRWLILPPNCNIPCELEGNSSG